MLTLKGEGLGGRGLGEDFRSHVLVWHFALCRTDMCHATLGHQGAILQGQNSRNVLKKILCEYKIFVTFFLSHLSTRTGASVAQPMRK